MPDLFQEYVQENPALTPFYAGFPRALFDTPPEARPWHPELVEELRLYQRWLGLEPRFQGNEVVIITGQQAGLFTGPLYTIYKACTAILLARRLEEKHGVPCLPVFWIASDDHDFEEVSSARFLTKDHQNLSIRYQPGGDRDTLEEKRDELIAHGEYAPDGFPMWRVPLSASLHDAIDLFATRMQGSERSGDVALFLHETLDQADSMAEWFARLLAGLFQHTPLVIFAPHFSAARQAAAPVLEKEIAEPLVSTRLLLETSHRLESAGYPAQVVKKPDECCFFIEMGGRRRKVRYADGRFIMPEERMSCAQEDMLTFVRATPEIFSPNVALRCVTQQVIFPSTAAYVAGPGELAYWAEFKALFEHFNQPMPVVWPRARAVISSLKLDTLMEKFQLTPEALQRPKEELIRGSLRETASNPALDLLAEKRPALEEALAGLKADLKTQNLKDPRGCELAERIEKHARRGFARLESLLARSDEEQVRAVCQQIDRLCTTLAPDRAPQERVYSVFSYLFEYGGELVPRLLDKLDIDSFELNRITL